MCATPSHIALTHLDGLVFLVSNGEGELDRLTDGGQASGGGGGQTTGYGG